MVFTSGTKFVYGVEINGMENSKGLVGVLLARVENPAYNDIGPYVRADGVVEKYLDGRDAENFYVSIVEDAEPVTPESDERGIFIGHVSGNAFVGRATSTYVRDGRMRFIADDEPSDVKIASKFYPFKKRESKMSVVVGLTDKQKRDLSKQALDASKRLGYCDETKNVLRAMGLPTDVERVERVTVELEITSTEGKSFGVNNLRYDSPTGLVRVTEQRIVKREEV